MAENTHLVEVDESERQQCLQHVQGFLQELRGSQTQPGSSPQEGQLPGTNSTRSPGTQPQGGSINSSLTDAEFAETVAHSLSESLQNGRVLKATGAVDFDSSLLSGLGPGTSIKYIGRGNFEELKKACLQVAEESEDGEYHFMIAPRNVNMPGLTSRVVHTSQILKFENSNLQMPAEDVTSAGDAEARNAAAENK